MNYKGPWLLVLYAAFAGMPNAMINQEVVSAVTEVALSEKLNYPTGKLSGGQKRKLSLAISFIGRPKAGSHQSELG